MCTVKGSFNFYEEIAEQDFEFFMVSLGVDSIFTNVLLEKTIDICTNTLFENIEKVEDLSKRKFKEFLSLGKKYPILFLTESSTSKLMELLWDHFHVQHWLMLFLHPLKRIGYTILHMALNLLTTSSMLIISLFYSLDQNI